MELQKAKELAENLMQKHGLEISFHGWGFKFDSCINRFGVCKRGKRIISLSSKLVSLNNELEVRDTILHEIAHALAPHGAGHGEQWREKALSIGCNGSRCCGKEVITPPAKYTAICGTCGRVVNKNRMRVLACGQCCKTRNGGKFSSEYILNFKRNI